MAGGPIPAIPKNQFKDFTKDLSANFRASPSGQQFSATVELTGSDKNSSNDKKTSNSIPTGTPKGSFTIGTISYTRMTRVMTVSITNNSGGDFTSRFMVVKVRIIQNGKESEVILATGTASLGADPIPNGATRTTPPTIVGNLAPGTMIRIEVNAPGGINVSKGPNIP